MSNTNGQATCNIYTVTPERADDAHISSESSKPLSERTLTDLPMDADEGVAADMDHASHPASIHRELIAIAETDNLTIPWSDLKQIAKQRILEVKRVPDEQCLNHNIMG